MPEPQQPSYGELRRRGLGRIRPQAGPIDQQVAKYHRSTIALLIILACVGVLLLALFACFRRPDIGLGVVALLIVPPGLLAWLDFRKLERAVEKHGAWYDSQNPNAGAAVESTAGRRGADD